MQKRSYEFYFVSDLHNLPQSRDISNEFRQSIKKKIYHRTETPDPTKLPAKDVFSATIERLRPSLDSYSDAIEAACEIHDVHWFEAAHLIDPSTYQNFAMEAVATKLIRQMPVKVSKKEARRRIRERRLIWEISHADGTGWLYKQAHTVSPARSRCSTHSAASI